MQNVSLSKPSTERVEASPGEEFRRFVAILTARYRTIIFTVIISVALALVFIWSTTPLYSSSVQLIIDPRKRQLVENEIAPTGLGTSAAGADTWLMESQVEVFNSRQIIDALIQSENLTADREFAGDRSRGLLAPIKNVLKTIIYGPNKRFWSDKDPYEKAVSTLRDQMDVERLRNTYVIEATLRSENPEKAARLANRLAEIYMRETNNAASDTTRETAELLTSKLQELGKQANEASRAVEDYRRENGLIDANSTLLVEQQLTELNRKLSDARSQVQSTLARLNQVRAAVAGGGPSAIEDAEIGASNVLSRFRTDLAQIESQLAEAEMTYLASHPRLKRLEERRAALLSAMSQEYNRILKRLDVAHRTEQENAASLEANVRELESKMATSNTSSVRLNELEREAESSRALYQKFLQRSKEAWEQVDLPSNTARIISPAVASAKPSSPQVMLLLPGSLVFGLFVGVFLAVGSHVLTGPSRKKAHGKETPTDRSIHNIDTKEIPAELKPAPKRALVQQDARPEERPVKGSLLDQFV